MLQCKSTLCAVSPLQRESDLLLNAPVDGVGDSWEELTKFVYCSRSLYANLDAPLLFLTPGLIRGYYTDAMGTPSSCRPPRTPRSSKTQSQSIFITTQHPSFSPSASSSQNPSPPSAASTPVYTPLSSPRSPSPIRHPAASPHLPCSPPHHGSRRTAPRL